MYVKITREYCFWWSDEVQDEVLGFGCPSLTMAHHIALFIPYFIGTIPYSPSLINVPVFVDVLPSFVDWRRRQFFSLASILSPQFFSIFVVHRTRVFIGCVSGLRSGPSAGGEARRACVPADGQSLLVAGCGEVAGGFNVWNYLSGCVWKWLVPHCTQWFCWSLSLLNGYWEYSLFSDNYLSTFLWSTLIFSSFIPEPVQLMNFRMEVNHPCRLSGWNQAAGS